MFPTIYSPIIHIMYGHWEGRKYASFITVDSIFHVLKV